MTALTVLSTLPKGAKTLGGPEAKFPAGFPAEKLSRAIAKGGKAGTLIRLIAESGAEGADLIAAGVAAGIPAGGVSAYPSFDVRNAFGVRIVRLGSGKVALLARPGIYSARELRDAIAAGIAASASAPALPEG